MLSNEAKELFARFDMEYAPIAVKFSFGKPEGLPHVDEPAPFCQFLKKAQVTGESFYVIAADDTCFGRMVLGMIDKPPFAASGQAGYDYGVFKSQAANARLYTQMPIPTRGSINYVSFAPVADCDFDPDLIICVADTDQTFTLLRASTYYSGDVWETKSTPVMSCAWFFAYPYVEDKVNAVPTGMSHGMGYANTYPGGLHIVTIPFGKISSVVSALGEMDWQLKALSGDPEDLAELDRREAKWKDLEASGKAVAAENIDSLMP